MAVVTGIIKIKIDGVTLDSYWQRRINPGEAIVVQPQSKTFKSKKDEPKLN